MTEKSEAVLKAVLELDDDELRWLVEQLVVRVPPDDLDGPMTEDELFAELERRRAEYLADPSIGIPWSELKRQLEQ